MFFFLNFRFPSSGESIYDLKEILVIYDWFWGLVFRIDCLFIFN